jgi:LuxR family maltose regulon positive regulatory protein
VLRPQLLEKLNTYLERPLTLVSAPAGYGKTTLVSSWLSSLDSPSAWVSLDEYDDDLEIFLTYFLTAVRSLFPDAANDSLALLHAPELPPIRVLVSTLLNDLTQIDGSYVLVLDDYHTIHSMDIHDVIGGLLRYPPPGLHLVLATRKDPPLKLIDLRARSWLNDIRIQELRLAG